ASMLLQLAIMTDKSGPVQWVKKSHCALYPSDQARLKPLVLSASGHERMVNGRAAARAQKRMDLSEEITWFGNMLNFGDILNMDGPLVEIGSRSVFPNSDVGGWQ